MRVAAIVQARMGSTRLPGKVMKQVAGKPLLSHLLERLGRSESLDTVVVATTEHPQDDEIVELVEQLGCALYRGSEADVLGRYYGAASQERADIVVRVTSDCPLLDPLVVDQVVGHFLDQRSEFDYVSNHFDPSFPRGMTTEVCSFSALERAHREALLPEEREHVTLYLYRHPEIFRIGSFQYRLTVDTPEDLALVRKIVEELYPSKPHFTMQDIYKLLRSHPDWVHINAHVRQKEV